VSPQHNNTMNTAAARTLKTRNYALAHSKAARRCPGSKLTHTIRRQTDTATCAHNRQNTHASAAAPSAATRRQNQQPKRIDVCTHAYRRGGRGQDAENGGSLAQFFEGELPGKIGTLLLLLVVARAGVYIPIPGVDRDAYQAAMEGQALFGYVDSLSGGSLSKLGIFSLGIIPYINASIVFQLLTSAFPGLKKLQREEGEAGRRKFNQYMRLTALAFSLAQALGQCLYVRDFVIDGFSVPWLTSSVLALSAGSMVVMYIGEVISELKLGNGTSLLIFVNIVSSLPSSVGQSIFLANQADASGPGASTTLAVLAGAFFLTSLGIVYVQEAERKIPLNYAQRFRGIDNAGRGGRGIGSSSYLPFKVNSAGVMPIIFSSSLLSLPGVVARFSGSELAANAARAVYPGGPAYLPVSVGLIVFFNYFYTFLQLEPTDVADQLKRGGASIPGVRPGTATASYITTSLERMSFLGSVFLGLLATTPAIVEGLTDVQAFRGFAGTSLLILVGVATDSARRVRSELLLQSYSKSGDELYK